MGVERRLHPRDRRGVLRLDRRRDFRSAQKIVGLDVDLVHLVSLIGIALAVDARVLVSPCRLLANLLARGQPLLSFFSSYPLIYLGDPGPLVLAAVLEGENCRLLNLIHGDKAPYIAPHISHFPVPFPPITRSVYVRVPQFISPPFVDQIIHAKGPLGVPVLVGIRIHQPLPQPPPHIHRHRVSQQLPSLTTLRIHVRLPPPLPTMPMHPLPRHGIHTLRPPLW